MAEPPINGRGFTVDQLFTNHRFRLDYYQREYVWKREHVASLVNDLYQRFRASWSPGDSRAQTSEYAPYFLGPFVYFSENADTYLVDGQQRVTTLHLLLMHVRRLLAEQQQDAASDDLSELDKLIRVAKHGQRTYTIDITERNTLLDTIHQGRPVCPDNPSPSVFTLYERALDLVEDFPDELRGEALLSFLDWLRDRVCLVGIEADSRGQGWEIFTSMNDRGVKLTPIELLKGFLLSQVSHERTQLNEKWREALTQLSASDASAPSEFVTTMLTARYADLSTTGPDSDYGRIATAAHEWVRGNYDRLGLHGIDAYRRFITEDFCALANRYAALLHAAADFKTDHYAIRFNALNGLTAQYTAILAAVDPHDGLGEFWNKADQVAAFLDLLYVRRFVNGTARQPDALDGDIAELVPQLRQCRTSSEVNTLLSNRIFEMDEDFTGITLTKFGLRHDNAKQVRYLLARVTAWVEKECGKPDSVPAFLGRKRPYEIEHIWADKHERFLDQASTRAKFDALRNRLGALLLLEKSDNASYRDDPLSRKIEGYRNQNTLAAAMHPDFYRAKNPGFQKLRGNKAYGLEKLFRGYKDDPDFTEQEIERRQKLYQRLCELVWDPEGLGFNVPKQQARPEQRAKRRSQARYDVTLGELLDHDYIAAGQELFGTRAGQRYTAEFTADGHIKVETGELFPALSPAAMFVLDRQSANGWTFWQVRRSGGKATLKKVRDDYLKSGIREQQEQKA